MRWNSRFDSKGSLFQISFDWSVENPSLSLIFLKKIRPLTFFTNLALKMRFMRGLLAFLRFFCRLSQSKLTILEILAEVHLTCSRLSLA
jgi:hypothetical protein